MLKGILFAEFMLKGRKKTTHETSQDLNLALKYLLSGHKIQPRLLPWPSFFSIIIQLLLKYHPTFIKLLSNF